VNKETTDQEVQKEEITKIITIGETAEIIKIVHVVLLNGRIDLEVLMQEKRSKGTGRITREEEEEDKSKDQDRKDFVLKNNQ